MQIMSFETVVFLVSYLIPAIRHFVQVMLFETVVISHSGNQAFYAGHVI